MLPPDRLRAYPCFADLDSEEIARLAEHSSWRDVAESEVVFREHDNADHLFVVVEGQVDIFSTDAAGRNRVVDTLSKGDLMLLSALVPPHEARFGGMARAPTRLIAIEAPVLRELLAARPTVGFGVMGQVARALSSRLEGARYQLASER